MWRYYYYGAASASSPSPYKGGALRRPAALFGNLAAFHTSEAPKALRTRLTTGLPFSQQRTRTRPRALSKAQADEFPMNFEGEKRFFATFVRAGSEFLRKPNGRSSLNASF